MRAEQPKSEIEDLAAQVNNAMQASELSDLDAGFSRFDRTVNKVVELAGVGVLASILSIVFLNAVGRYTGLFILIWGDEMVISLLPWLGMLGMFLSIRRRQIIRIDFFVEKLPMRLRVVSSFAINLLAASTFIYLALISFEYVQFFGNDRTIYLEIRKGWFMSALVIGPALAAAAYLWIAWGSSAAGRSSSTKRMLP